MSQAPDPTTWIVLNGLPRHLGQAQAMEGIIDVRMVVHLACSAHAVVAERSGRSVGGDRSQREDDAPEAIR
ncbi:MAG: hypothetical protein ABSG53_29470, partial [Thermoguttaceae bacterium]